MTTSGLRGGRYKAEGKGVYKSAQNAFPLRSACTLKSFPPSPPFGAPARYLRSRSQSYMNSNEPVTCVSDARIWNYLDVIIGTKLDPQSWESQSTRALWEIFISLCPSGVLNSNHYKYWQCALSLSRVKIKTQWASSVAMNFHLSLHPGSWTSAGSAKTDATEGWPSGLHL